jgi:hypothetical protein
MFNRISIEYIRAFVAQSNVNIERKKCQACKYFKMYQQIHRNCCLFVRKAPDSCMINYIDILSIDPIQILDGATHELIDYHPGCNIIISLDVDGNLHVFDRIRNSHFTIVLDIL